MVPATMRTEDFHFLAAPAPQCASKCVALISRFFSGSLAHASQLQMTRLCCTRKMPCRQAIEATQQGVAINHTCIQ